MAESSHDAGDRIPLLVRLLEKSRGDHQPRIQHERAGKRHTIRLLIRFGDGRVEDSIALDRERPRVREERERDPGLFAEQSRIMLIAQADRGNICVLCSKFRFMLAQLRDVLPAEDSAVMPEERDYGGLVFPQRSEADLPVPGIGQYDIGERSAERRIGHLSLDQ